MIKEVVIVGLGAIGALYAWQLSRVPGVRLRVAMDANRIERYKQRGIMFNDEPLELECFDPQRDTRRSDGCVDPVDLVIIATKYGGYVDALNLIKPVVGSNTVILPLLNGIDSERIAAEMFGAQCVIYGFFMGHTATRQQNSIHQDGRYKTYIGRIEASGSTLNDITDLFNRADIKYKVEPDITQYMWQKFIVNIGMNQATALLHCTYGHLQTCPQAAAIMRSLMMEAAAVATALGIADTQQMVDKACSLLMTLDPKDGSSMYQDVMAARATEVDIFAGRLCALGVKLGIPTPLNEACLLIIKALPVTTPA